MNTKTGLPSLLQLLTCFLLILMTSQHMTIHRSSHNKVCPHLVCHALIQSLGAVMISSIIGAHATSSCHMMLPVFTVLIQSLGAVMISSIIGAHATPSCHMMLPVFTVLIQSLGAVMISSIIGAHATPSCHMMLPVFTVGT